MAKYWANRWWRSGWKKWDLLSEGGKSSLTTRVSCNARSTSRVVAVLGISCSTMQLGLVVLCPERSVSQSYGRTRDSSDILGLGNGSGLPGSPTDRTLLGPAREVFLTFEATDAASRSTFVDLVMIPCPLLLICTSDELRC